MVHHARKLNVPVTIDDRRYLTYRSRYASNVVKHDQIENNWGWWLSQSRLPRVVNPGDEVHLSTGLLHYDPSGSGFGPGQGERGYVEILKKAIAQKYPLTTINQDDGLGWISLPFNIKP